MGSPWLTGPYRRWAERPRCGRRWPNKRVNDEPDHPLHTCRKPIGHLERSRNPKKDFCLCACGCTDKGQR